MISATERRPTQARPAKPRVAIAPPGGARGAECPRQGIQPSIGDYNAACHAMNWRAPWCTISPMFACPACGQPSLNFHNIIQSGKLIERRVRCAACGYSRPITWKEKRSLLVEVGIAKAERRAKSRTQGR
jgi:hypothetical protein